MTNQIEKYEYEYTDTFNGEANYCWVKRGIIEGNDTNIVRRVKAELGLNGVRCRKSDYGDMLRLDLVGACQVIFINWYDDYRG